MNTPSDQLEPFVAPPKPKMLLGKVVMLNFAIMLTYMMFFWNSEYTIDPYSDLEDLIMCAVFLAAQVGLNMLIGFVLLFNPKYRHLGSAMLIGGVIIALIGFGTCITTQDYFWRL